MIRPELRAVVIPEVVKTRSSVNVVLMIEDTEGTDYKYAKQTDYELYAGEDGIWL